MELVEHRKYEYRHQVVTLLKMQGTESLVEYDNDDTEWVDTEELGV